MPTYSPADGVFWSYDGVGFDTWIAAKEHEIKEQLRFCGFSDQAIDLLRHEHEPFKEYGHRLKAILDWDGRRGPPALRVRRPRKPSTP